MFNAISLWRMARPLWSLSFILGLLTLISGIALLAYSGWFISAAAMAGVAGSQAGSFNYLRPGAMIRLLANHPDSRTLCRTIAVTLHNFTSAQTVTFKLL